MASKQETTVESPRQDQTDFMQAFQEIARGERAATALENQLTSMEAKLDALLEEAERRQAEAERIKQSQEPTNTADAGETVNKQNGSA